MGKNVLTSNSPAPSSQLKASDGDSDANFPTLFTAYFVLKAFRIFLPSIHNNFYDYMIPESCQINYVSSKTKENIQIHKHKD